MHKAISSNSDVVLAAVFFLAFGLAPVITSWISRLISAIRRRRKGYSSL